MSWQKELETRIRNYLAGYTACHDYFHLERVHNYAMEIAKNLPKKFKFDEDVLWAASFLHDIGYKGHEQDMRNHHKYGMAIAKKWLKEVSFPNKKIPDVVEVIRLHDNFHWDENGEKTKHVETLIIQDADRIDALGAIGIVRITYFHGEYGYPIYNPEKVPKTKKIWLNHSLLDQLKRDPMSKWQNLNFDYSKKMSRDKYEFLNKFYLELKKELEQHHKQ